MGQCVEVYAIPRLGSGIGNVLSWPPLSWLVLCCVAVVFYWHGMAWDGVTFLFLSWSWSRPWLFVVIVGVGAGVLARILSLSSGLCLAFSCLVNCLV